ncbi:MAG: alpha/beta hydrolase [Saprospiraceae bacterium]|nr:alpha/beta hydrolase [Saprospiraceae bacterium]MCF8252441.1 alpha/beta hydrolase [Saprospiraceae bacterium]MCF8282288.1 alpha/beta hydrolase [Bacteroidales bacterium]MCF8314033.1 alpha/beta hydrolase [Saprospiraceae bacterium]MCF8442771.1 alpha/beta hydrolase [Saprospiraceae bacterium]
MEYPVTEEGGFKYIETKGGEQNLLLLHGLFGALSNFTAILQRFGTTYNVVVPILPIFEMPFRKLSVSGLVDYVAAFVEKKGYKKVHLLGNSLGGHISLLYALAYPERIVSITLTGSSGLFESAMGSTFPKRGDYDYIKKKTEDTFYNPEVATKELVDEVFNTVNDRNKAIRVVATAKSAIRHNLRERLQAIIAPTLLIWGKEDKVTPAFVGEEFHERIQNSQLFMVDKCGHAPMMEHPEVFNEHLENFLKEVAK